MCTGVSMPVQKSTKARIVNRIAAYVQPNGSGKQSEKRPYTVESNIPLPSARNSSSGYPWDQLRVGDSFFVADKPVSKVNQAVQWVKLRTHHSYACRTVVEKSVKGARVWRTA